MKTNPFISWQEWEGHVLDFFRFALLELVKQPDLPHLEAHKTKDNLNRRFSLVCRRHIGAWSLDENRPQFSPYFSGRNQSRVEDTLPHESENKEPDCQVIAYFDPLNSVQLYYTVECKRLYLANDDTPYGSCRYYVEDGVLRFIKREHSYGIDVPSGLMIAYFQSGELEPLFGQVNHYCNKNSVSSLVLNDKWQPKGISELGQDITRTEMKPEQFKLHHFWLDLR